MKNYNISLLGFGGVNRALAELIAERNDTWANTLGFRLTIVGVSDLRFGSIISPNGIDANMLTKTNFSDGYFAKLSGGSSDPRSLDVIRDAPADIVAEATFTDPITGEPAISFCQAAFEAGRSIVTTNKGPVALAAAELQALAATNGVGFEFEGSVMSGTPVIRAATEMLAGAGLTGFVGIMNGTSNYVLGRMENGLTLADAVAEAQEKGFAEADPSADIGGGDVRLKVAILAQQLLGANIKPSDVSCEGITKISVQDINDAAKNNSRWKLIGGAGRDESGNITAYVAPRKLPMDHPLASIGGATNAISFETELLGDVTISGPGAGPTETAFALLSDIIALHNKGKIKTSVAAAE